MAVLTFDDALLSQVDAKLAELGVLHRRPALKKALGKGGDVVLEKYKALLPQPGMPGYVGSHHDPKLFETVGRRIKDYDRAVVVVVGVDKAKLAPGATKRPTNLEALVEKGFVIGGSAKTQARKGHKKSTSASAGKVVAGRHSLENAISATKSTVEATVTEAIEAEVKRVMG